MLKDLNVAPADYNSLRWQYFEPQGSKGLVIRENAAGQTVDIWALREPEKCILNSLTDNTENTNFEFDREVQEIILGYSLEDFVQGNPEARALRNKAETMIEEKDKATSRTDFPKYAEEFRGNEFFDRGWGDGDINNFRG